MSEQGKTCPTCSKGTLYRSTLDGRVHCCYGKCPNRINPRDYTKRFNKAKQLTGVQSEAPGHD